MDFILNCDMKCVKEILNRQAGSPTYGCFCCDAPTSKFQTRDRVRGNNFTTDEIIDYSERWRAEWLAKVSWCSV